MLGFRRVAVHLALVALLLRGFLPAGWMPAAHGQGPLVMCSVLPVADDGFSDGHTGDGDAPGKADPRAHETCAFAGVPGLAAPDHTVFFTPVLQEDFDFQDDNVTQVRALHDVPAPQAPRAPPSSI